jgi:mycothiol synthase
MDVALRVGELADEARGEVRELARVAGVADGVAPLSEPFLLRLRGDQSGPGSRHFLVRDGDRLIGYGQLDTTDAAGGPEAELVVHPLYRHRGVGRALLAAITEAAEDAGGQAPLRIWAHGDHPSASALGHRAGFERYRVLWQMRRSLAMPVPEVTLPVGIRLRPFMPGTDEPEWLRVNGRAFADHPDQGRWTSHDLLAREREPWFDPAGFLLAEDAGGRLVGFHWTKIHQEGSTRIGEVYVLGVDPGAQGTGLGAALTAAGLRHLRDRGLAEVMLYVDEGNPAAVALYTKLGFARWVTDVAFRQHRT